MAKTRTKAQVSHYEVQKGRRASNIEEWRKYRKYVIKEASVELHETPRRMKRGVMVSADGAVPSITLDANLHEIPPHTISTIHRHSWDAILFVTKGSGWTEIDGQRFHWRPWDTLYLPSWSWHRHGNEGDHPARFTTWSVQPLVEMLGMAILEEGGDEAVGELPPAPRQSPAPGGKDAYSRRLERLAAAAEDRSTGQLISAYDELTFRVTPRGARSAFLVDPSLGYQTSGLTAVMHQLAPGLYQSRHRHGGEAWLYVVTGHGHSEIDGESYHWQAGDLVVVDHWAWHQHFNDDPQNLSSLIRVHNFHTLYSAMQALLDPLELFEEPPRLDAPDVRDVKWPSVDSNRPTA